MKKALLLIPVLFIAFYFLHYAGLGLHADFTHDDLMNMSWSLLRPWQANFLDLVTIWRPAPTYRPVGAIVYKASLDWAGLNLFPMRVFCYILLGANMFLLYGLTRRLSQSREIAFLAVLLHGFHYNFGALYYNNGTAYDILCFFFTFAALLFYVRVAQEGRPTSLWQWMTFGILVLLALNSKEMALAIPIFVGFYELLFHPPEGGSIRQIGVWFKRAWPGPAVSALFAAIYYFGRITGPGGVSSSGMYHFRVGPTEYLKQTGHYLDELFYRIDWLSPSGTAAFLLVLLAVALLFRPRLLVFSALLFATGILPIAFIPPRSLNAAYIPVAGLAVYAAALLVIARDFLVERVPLWLGRKRQGSQEVISLKKVLLFALVAYCLLNIHQYNTSQWEAWQKEYGPIRSYMTELQRLHPTLPKGARILVVQDPFGEFNWASHFIALLVYRDPFIPVSRLESMENKPTPAEVGEYSFRLGYENGRLRDLSAAEVPVNP